MYKVQQIAGQQVRPQQYQYGTVSGYYPLQTTDPISGMFTSMMPMIMMIMMMAILMPMMKGVTGSSKS
ncbi:cell division protein FtsH [Dehalococcoides mccartyi]|uniref:cell division protein FtsH n=1 Tax=Dehalococcoides mccartyi TaxID=61435 RepID=UPI001A1BEC55|nr:cell division protein FtsH [Dehalococcoides mccartyi]MBJ7531105.1 cell division protein FtsH [Dehalococcoides mccartyi]